MPGKVLDPSYGGCAFLRVAIEELQNLHCSTAPELVFGADIDGETAVWAAHLASIGVPAGNLVKANFLELHPDKDLPRAAAVVGNPPYVRHHWIDAETSKSAMRAMDGAGVRLPKTSSLWAYFVIHASRFVAPGGRMALLLPSSLLNAKYASAVTNYLIANFGSVSVVRVDERIYEGAQEETVVLLASDAGATTPTAKFVELKDLAELDLFLDPIGKSQDPIEGATASDRKLSLLNEDCRQLFSRLTTDPRLTPLGDIAEIRIGVVTGANGFFVIDRLAAEELGVGEWTVPVVSRNNWILDEDFSTADHAGFVSEHKNALLIAAPNAPLDGNSRFGKYVSDGETQGLDRRHHCKREPWWSIKLPKLPDAFLPYMGASHRGLAINHAGAFATNALHHLYFKAEGARNPSAVALSSWSTLTSLSAEVFGRHYGGGILKLEPTAARRLLVLNTADGHKRDGSSVEDGSPRERADRLMSLNLGIGDAELGLLRAGLQRLSTRRSGIPSNLFPATADGKRAKSL
jgi:hypothetical protein